MPQAKKHIHRTTDDRKRLEVQTTALPATQRQERLGWLLVLTGAAVLLVAIAYLPVLDSRAMSYDDHEYVVDNWLVLNPGLDSTARFFKEVTAPSTVRGYYQPLTMLSLMLDVAAGGGPEHLRPFRVTSLALHLANTCLVILLLYLLSGSTAGAIIAGLLFGLHPLTVEPVAWTADRKTVLAMFFGLACLILYIMYVRSRDARPQRPAPLRAWLWLASALFCYALALLCKPTITPIAVLLILLDWWPLSRIAWRTIAEKIPFLLVGCVSAVISYISQRNTAGVRPPGTDSIARIPLVIGHDIIFYIEKLLVPAGLTPHYPMPQPLSLANLAVLAGVTGTITIVVLLIVSLRRTRAAVAGALFFFLAILPTLGIIGFTNVLTSDKYVYFPMIGLLIPLAFGIRWIWKERVRERRVLVIGALVFLGAELVTLRTTLAHWRDSGTLARHMLKVSPQVPQPYVMLGAAMAEEGNPEGAIKSYYQALAIEPGHHPAHYGLAWLLASLGRDQEAIEHYSTALRDGPGVVSSRNNLANLLARHGRFEEALEHYAVVLEIRPRSAEAHYNMATTLLALNRPEEATDHLNAAIQLRPDRADVLNNLGMAMSARGQIESALDLYARSLELKPGDATTHYNMANALAAGGRHEEAVRQYREAIRLRSDYASAHNNLANSLIKLGRREEAIAEFREALRLEPAHARAHANLADALADAGDWAAAVSHYEQSLQIRPAIARVQYRFGVALARLGRSDDAAKALREALRLDPKLQDAARQLAALPSASAPASLPQ